MALAQDSLIENAPAVTDIDRDGRLDILISGHDSRGSGAVYRYELTHTRGKTGAKSWPLYRRDARRTGAVATPPLTQTLCPSKVRVGYWLAAADGGIFSYCDAIFHGSTGNLTLNKPIVGMAPTATGNGYWMVASDGGIFAFGDAPFHGSTGAITLNKPIVGMAPTATGNGYWMVASDGGIFAFGDAVFYGSTGAVALSYPVADMAATKSGEGYWIVTEGGGVHAFGDALFLGSLAVAPNAPVRDLAPLQ